MKKLFIIITFIVVISGTIIITIRSYKIMLLENGEKIYELNYNHFFGYYVRYGSNSIVLGKTIGQFPIMLKDFLLWTNKTNDTFIIRNLSTNKISRRKIDGNILKMVKITHSEILYACRKSNGKIAIYEWNFDKDNIQIMVDNLEGYNYFGGSNDNKYYYDLKGQQLVVKTNVNTIKFYLTRIKYVNLVDGLICMTDFNNESYIQKLKTKQIVPLKEISKSFIFWSGIIKNDIYLGVYNDRLIEIYKFNIIFNRTELIDNGNIESIVILNNKLYYLKDDKIYSL